MRNSASQPRDGVSLRRRSAAPSRFRSWFPSLLAFIFVILAASGCASAVRVEWHTETEMNTAGFNLYRGESAEGPFDVKVNEQLIPSSADALTGGDYVYIDKNARAGVTYYYRLEEVERNGATVAYGPISVRAGGLAWWHIAALGGLGGLMLFVWLRGGKSVRVGPPPGG